MRVLYVNMDKLVEKKLLERLLPRAAREGCDREGHHHQQRAQSASERRAGKLLVRAKAVD